MPFKCFIILSGFYHNDIRTENSFSPSFCWEGSVLFVDQKACLFFSVVLSSFFPPSPSGLPHILWFVEGLNPNSYIKPWGSQWDQFKGSPFSLCCSALLLTIPLLQSFKLLLSPAGWVGLCSVPASLALILSPFLLVASRFLTWFAWWWSSTNEPKHEGINDFDWHYSNSAPTAFYLVTASQIRFD